MPAGVSVWVCVASADPVKVSAGTVRFGDVPLHAVVDPVPAAIFVAAQLPLVAVAPFDPAGVPALVALVVPSDPVKVGCETVPLGVMVALPPVPPTSPFAAIVPCKNFPFRLETSVVPPGQAPLMTIMIEPRNDNTLCPVRKTKLRKISANRKTALIF